MKNAKVIWSRHCLDLLLTMAGGYMDSYSYLAHGKVFATGQTGNFVLLAVNLARQEWTMIAHYVTPIILFWLGIFTSMHMRSRHFKENVFRYEGETLRIEILLFLVIGFLPDSIPHTVVNSLISFCAAIQLCCFRTLGEHAAYASVFCTGNMRSCAELLYLGIAQKQRQSLRSGLAYLRVLAAFFAGVLLGVLCDYWLYTKAAWGICVILLFVLAVRHMTEKQTGPTG